jgi:hypothetical protein
VTICDGRDDILGRKPDSKNTVTIVTTDTEAVENILFPTGSPAGRKGAFDTKCQKCFCVTLGKSNRTRPACAGDKEWI